MSTEDWDDWGESDDEATASSRISPPPQSADAPLRAQRQRRIAAVEEQLRGYLLDVVDQSVRDRVNAALQKRSANFVAFASYFESNAEALSKYTVETELGRMRFAVTKDGSSASAVADVLREYRLQPLLAVWSFANQAIYADILQCMQQLYLRPDLSVGIVADRSFFEIDLDANCLRASGNFVVTTPRSRGSRDGRPSKLELASFEATVFVDFASRRVRQELHAPSVRMVFDDALGEAAAAIAELQEEGPNPNLAPTFEDERERLVTLDDVRGRLLANTHLGVSVLAERVRETSGAMLAGLVTGIGRFIGADKAAVPEEDSLRDLLLHARGGFKNPNPDPDPARDAADASPNPGHAESEFRDLFSKLSVAADSSGERSGGGSDDDDDVGLISFADFMGGGEEETAAKEAVGSLNREGDSVPFNSVTSNPVQLRARPQRR